MARECQLGLGSGGGEVDSFILEVCIKNGACGGWKVGRGVPDGLAAFPERGFDLLRFVEPDSLCVADSAEGLEPVVKLSPNAVLVGFSWAGCSGSMEPGS